MARGIKRPLPLVVEALKAVIKNTGRVQLSPLFHTYGLQSYTQNPIHKNLLESEIETVKPDGILCWGKDSRTAVSDLLEIKLKDNRISYDDVREGYTISNKKTKFISTPHPSQLTRPKTWLTFYNINLPDKDPSDHYNRPKFLSELIMNAIK